MTLLRFTLVGLMLFGTGCNQDKRARLEKENKELAATLESVAKTTNLDMQAKCAQQARAEFKAQGWEKESMAGFTNHYNVKVNKCFVEITNSGSSRQPYVPTINRILFDAFEGKVYGEYMWVNSKGKKYWEVAPFICKVTSLSGEEIICNSTEQFDSLIKQ